MGIKKLFGTTLLIALIIFSGALYFAGSAANAENEEDVDYYTCGMHPSVRVSPEEYNKGSKSCPICNMNLTAVYKEESSDSEIFYGCGVDSDGKCPHCDLGQPDADCICGGHTFTIKGEKINCPVCHKPLRKLKQEEIDRLNNVVSRVKIKTSQARLAGVKTEPVIETKLYKKIRTTGKVAYDPDLAIAQEEFISALKSLDKTEENEMMGIRERALNLADSSRKKLKLLGLSGEQIDELEQERRVDSSLILPEDKMWIYGIVYEYELGWVKVGEEVDVTVSSLPGEKFKGIISSINPVVDPKTRSVRFRAEVDNPGLRLKPEMYVDIIIMSVYKGPTGEDNVLAIPKSAVLDTGVRKIVWVDKGDGEYEGRVVDIGPEAVSVTDKEISKFYPVLKGLSKDENVVTKANFLIDSQSQISGVASSAYSGALSAEEEKEKQVPVHQH
ncbi:MAG: efflux RND transporter periplasmic adaptor subunit [Candidatus Omnitrophica bacterium]|nr:efflux RND transporter periplasmic adaptor subunit [Candidatus Omnitrophota bacterium]